MHELSIALGIIEGAEEEVERQGGGRVHAVHLKLGPLSGVVKEALLFSYELACEGTALAGSTLLIEDTPLRIWCPRCASEQSPVALNQLTCAICGSAAARVTQGDQLEVTGLELQT